MNDNNNIWNDNGISFPNETHPSFMGNGNNDHHHSNVNTMTNTSLISHMSVQSDPLGGNGGMNGMPLEANDHIPASVQQHLSYPPGNTFQAQQTSKYTIQH